MPPETVQLFAAVRVPQANGLVLATRENAFAIGRKRDAIHFSGMARELTNFPAGFQVIQLNAWTRAARQCIPVIRGESDAFDQTPWSSKPLQFLPFVTIDHAEEPVVAAHQDAPLIGPEANKTQLDLIPETPNPPFDEYGASYAAFQGNTPILPGGCP